MKQETKLSVNVKQAQNLELSMASEDYLETILRVSPKQDGLDARSVDVADLMGVSKASVNKAMQLLKEEGFVEQAPYGRLALTESGLKVARNVWKRHKILRSFLIRDLGVDPIIADQEACKMEHALSKDTVSRWAAYLQKQGISFDE